MAYPKEKCDKCGEMVSTYLPLKAKHDKSQCSGRITEESMIEQEEQVVEVVVEPATKKAMTVLERDKERARKKAEILRKEAPNIRTGALTGDSELATLEKYAIASGLVPEGQRVFFGDQEKHNMYVGDGYEPIVEGGVHLRHGDLLMYHFPKEVTEARLEATGGFSHQRLLDQLADGPARDSGKKDASAAIE